MAGAAIFLTRLGRSPHQGSSSLQSNASSLSITTSTSSERTKPAGCSSRSLASMERTLWTRAVAIRYVSRMVTGAEVGESALGSPGVTSTVIAMLLPAL